MATHFKRSQLHSLGNECIRTRMHLYCLILFFSFLAFLASVQLLIIKKRIGLAQVQLNWLRHEELGWGFATLLCHWRGNLQMNRLSPQFGFQEGLFSNYFLFLIKPWLLIVRRVALAFNAPSTPSELLIFWTITELNWITGL